MPKTIIVSNRLPVRIDESGKPVRTTGGLASALAGLEMDSVWVGWPGIPAEEITDEAALRKDLAEIDVAPVLMESATLEGFYEGYSNATMWPLLHYMLERARFDPSWFPCYERANLAFAEEVLNIAEDGDSVWVHDYHLFLLPRILRESGRRLRIAFFLHTPFPSSEVFRALPERAHLLNGLLGADLIGFHTFNYLRHFRSSILRTLTIESEMDSIRQDQRDVRMGVYPIGHDAQGFANAMNSEGFRAVMAGHAAELSGKRLVLSVERLDYTKGIPQKLDAIRLFLESHPDEGASVVFVIIAVPSRENVEEYIQLTEEVQREVGSINGAHGTVGHAPVQFLHQSFPLPELAALYALADVCLVTPLIDGMNLVAKEYIDCKNESLGARPGVLVLSEFAGAAQEMSHAIMVNPHDVTETAAAIAKALHMADQEKRMRTEAMQARLRRTDSKAWAATFLKDLAATPLPVIKESDEPQFSKLTTRLVKSIGEGERVTLFLDYDGTLRDFVGKPEDAIPDPELGPLLQQLGTHPAIDLAVVSGRPASFLEKHLGGKGITLVAEHGYRWLLPGDEEWSLVHAHLDMDWREAILPLLEQAVVLTPGSHVEEKLSSLVWHYRQADPEFGLWRARGLLSELTDVTASLPVAVHHGKKIVEVASQMVNKGNAVKALMTDWQADIYIAAGDDQTDETMFVVDSPEDAEFITLKVGDEGVTRAQRRTDIRGLRDFLIRFAKELCQSPAGK